MSKDAIDKKESILLTKWKEEMSAIIRMKYGDIVGKKEIDEFLNSQIKDNIHNIKCEVVNNYKKVSVATDVLSLVDLIYKNDIILGGDGVMFIQHGLTPNPIIDFINETMALRKQYKKKRKDYPKGSFEYMMLDMNQLNQKIRINSLYGVLGYFRFIFYNLFLAQSVTNMGQHIISSCMTGFENFLSDAIKFRTDNELFLYLKNIKNEYKEKYSEKKMHMIPDVSVEDVLKRLVDKCGFPVTKDTIENIVFIVNNSPENLRKMYYYKNNFMEFNKLDYVKVNLDVIINSIDELLVPELYGQPQNVVDLIEGLWKEYECFVFYNYPLFDKIRQMKYNDRKSVLYVDTDSNFISLNQWYNYMKDEVLHTQNLDENTDFKIINLITIFLTKVVTDVLITLGLNMNMKIEHAKQLAMKNEFYLKRIVFASVKKRYFSSGILQEGVRLKPGNIEIKGYDFIKSVTKESLRKKYLDICLDDILMPEEIDLPSIINKTIDFEDQLTTDILSGDTQFFKQANVGIMEKYKDPYRIQGIKAVFLWNALCPEYTLELPTDVDIVPIKSLKKPAPGKKLPEGVAILHDKYPSIYERLVDEVYCNRNEVISNMDLNCIAKPKNEDIPVPEWLNDLMDVNKIVDSSIGLFTPILGALGVKIDNPTSTTTQFSTIVSL